MRQRFRSVTRLRSSYHRDATEFLKPASRPGAVLYEHKPVSSFAINSHPRVAQGRTYFSTARDGQIGRPTDTESDLTIYALSTAPGRAAIAIVRISGPRCAEIYGALCPNSPAIRPKNATLRSLYDPAKGTGKDAVLDPEALILYLPGPRTVTGEDVLELHIHGGPAIVKAVLAAIPRCVTSPFYASRQESLVRYAEPGEFTRRAFYNNRLDLTQIEALGDALLADTEEQRRLAVRGTSNALARRYESWRQQLLYARGELEALIDFAEDQHFEDTPAELVSSVEKQVKVLKRHLQDHVLNASRGELVRGGIKIALVGAPNAGKSSLLNRIVGREAAIVSKEEGTTRDVVEVGVDIGGFYCKFGDMAGLRREQITHTSKPHVLGSGPSSSIGEVEREGIRRAKSRALDSDLVIVVLSVEHEAPNSESFSVNIDMEVAETAARCTRDGKAVVYLINKTDQLPLMASGFNLEELVAKARLELTKRQEPIIPASSVSVDRIFAISCKEAAETNSLVQDPGGFQTLLNGLIKVFHEMTAPVCPGAGGVSIDPAERVDSLGATERQRLLLVECLGYLDAFLAGTEIPAGPFSEHTDDLDVVVAAENLRAAAQCLAKITGRGVAGDVEEVLGVVFEKFCVGK